MRIVLTFLIAVCIGEAGAQIVSRDSVHLKPLGSTVTGSFVLVNRVVPLPEGEFTLVATGTHGSTFAYGDYARQPHKLADVVLGQVADGQLRAAVKATALLALAGSRREWVIEPCKRDDTLLRVNVTPFMKQNYEQDCLLVNHFVNMLGPKATGIYASLADWTRQKGGATPLPTVLDVTITRIAASDFLTVRYLFNPEAYGCKGEAEASWSTSAWHKSRIAKDPEKARIADGVVDFGKAVQLRINEAFEGRRDVAERLAATTPQVLPCGKN
jgi:hypothetical protein